MQNPSVPQSTATDAPRLSTMGGGLIGSEILRIAAEIRVLVAEGREICNLTVGDFAPAHFPVPPGLARRVQEAVAAGETNYPPSNGLPALRESIAALYRDRLHLDYPPESVLVAAGARPLIYAAYRLLVDPGDAVVFPVPSWNAPYYCQMVGARPVPVAAGAETAFLPTRDTLADAVRGARLLVLNSPLNPTGTAFDADVLAGICDLVLEENARRGPGERPLYLLYDQVYWMLTYGGLEHVNPVSLCPEIRPYTLLVDAASKSFAATGLRVGWALGPTDLIRAMSDFLGHLGAWAPRPEQVAVAALLREMDEIADYHRRLKPALEQRLVALHRGILAMKSRGLPVDAVAPMGALYLSARFALVGRTAPGGRTLATNDDVRSYLLREAGLGVVPFQAFGIPDDTGWFRLSVGAVSMPQIEAVLPRVEQAVRAIAEARTTPSEPMRLRPFPAD